MSTETTTDFSSSQAKSKENRKEDQTTMSTETTTDFSSSQAKSKENRKEDQTTMSTETTTDFSSSQAKSPEFLPNVLFYKNEIPAHPNKEYIEEILNWREDYDELEYNHLYIQWLFPNREMGMNSLSCVLTNKEAEIIRTSEDLRGRVKAAFEMMLDFYGMELTKNNEFKLAQNSQERLAELNKRYNHNFLRITRILLALKELGHNELILPWMKFLADLIYKENKLNCAQSSFENYWINTLNDEDKLQLTDYRNTLLYNSNTKKSSRNDIASPRKNSIDLSFIKSSDISTKSKEKPISSSSDNVSPVNTTPNDNIENSTPNIFTTIFESLFTQSTNSMSSPPVSDTSKDTEATEFVDAKSTSTNIPDTIPKSTPTISTNAMASFQVSDTSKDTEAIATEFVDAKSTSTNIPDTVPKSTPTISTNAMASSQVSDTSKDTEAIATEFVDAKSTSTNIPDTVPKSTPTISTNAMASSQVSDTLKHAEAVATEDGGVKSTFNTTAFSKHLSRLDCFFNQF